MSRDADLVAPLLERGENLRLNLRKVIVAEWLSNLNQVMLTDDAQKMEEFLRLKVCIKEQQKFLNEVSEVVKKVQGRETRMMLIERSLSNFEELKYQYEMVMQGGKNSAGASSSLFTARAEGHAVVMHNEGARELVRDVASRGSVSGMRAEGGESAAVLPADVSEAGLSLVREIVSNSGEGGGSAPKAVVYGDNGQATAQVGTMHVASMNVHIENARGHGPAQAECCVVL